MTVMNRIFNLILLLGLSWATGCATSSKAKSDEETQTLISCHLESNDFGLDKTEEISVYRRRPEILRITKAAILDNADISRAVTVDRPGGVKSISIQFNQRGTLKLDSTTIANKSKRIAIRAAFPESRWLAAVMIRNRIEDGILLFTPDATPEETERIVKGINELAEELQDD